jgi:type I restriction enzyme S subunit
MKVSKGFKQTEIGEIPEDWEVKSLVNLGKFSKGSGIKKEESQSGTIPCIRYGEIYTKHHFFVSEFYSFISEDIACTARLIKYGDILFAGSGETKEDIGKCVAFVSNFNAYAGGDIVIYTPDRIRSVSLFLGYLLNSQMIQKQKTNLAQGDTVVHISSSHLSNIILPLPALKEQQAIAEVLSDMDRMISQTETLIEKKKAIKQGMMQELLRPKDGWEKVKLGDCIKVSRGGSPRPIQEFITTNSNGVNWIKIGDTDVYSKFIVSSVEKIIQEGIPYSRKVYSGDLLLSNSMSFGRPYILKIDGCIHDGWLVLQDFGDSFNLDFLYYLLSSKYVFNQYLNLASGSSVLNLNKELVKKIDLIKPKLMSEQQHIATVISDIDSQIETITEKLQKLKLQKQGMMQVLLTGRIRLT